MFPYSGLPKVPEPFVLHPNVLQHAINHPPVFDKGAEPTFMAPVAIDGPLISGFHLASVVDMQVS